MGCPSRRGRPLCPSTSSSARGQGTSPVRSSPRVGGVGTQAEIVRLSLPVLLHVQCHVVVVRVVPTTLAPTPSAWCLSRWGCHCCRVSRSLSRWMYSTCPFRVEGTGLGVPHLFHDSLSCRGSDACLLGLPAGCRGRSCGSLPGGCPFGRPRQCRRPGRGAGALGGQCLGREPELPRIALPAARPPKKNIPGGGRVRSSTCVPESAGLRAKAFGSEGPARDWAALAGHG